jgi:hypothetical protein
MTKLFSNSILFFSCALILFSSCGGDDSVESLSGKYVLSGYSIKNCSDPDENINATATADGFCEEEDGEKFCIDICFTFTSTTYTTVVTISSDSFSFSSNGSGTFDPDNGASEICLDGDCTTVTVTNGGDRFSFKTTDPDTGCEVSVEMKKA